MYDYDVIVVAVVVVIVVKRRFTPRRRAPLHDRVNKAMSAI